MDKVKKIVPPFFVSSLEGDHRMEVLEKPTGITLIVQRRGNPGEKDKHGLNVLWKTIATFNVLRPTHG